MRTTTAGCSLWVNRWCLTLQMRPLIYSFATMQEAIAIRLWFRLRYGFTSACVSSTGLALVVKYGDVKPRSLSPVYRTQEEGGLRVASAIGSPPFLYLFVTSVWTRACIWDPRYQTACMQAGKGPPSVVHARPVRSSNV